MRTFDMKQDPVMPFAEASKCPRCGAEIVYNGNYLCSSLATEWCGWALPSDRDTPRSRSLVMGMKLGLIRQVAY